MFASLYTNNNVDNCCHKTADPEFKGSHILLCPTPQLHHQVTVALGHVTSHPDRVGSAGKEAQGPVG